MNHHTPGSILGLLLLKVLLGGCGITPPPGQGAAETLVILSWNIQALFDGLESGLEFEEYREAGGWSEEKYQARLIAISQAVLALGPQTPDILALQEVENPAILRSLAEGPLANQGYGWTFFAANAGAALGVGILSKIPLEQPKAHSSSEGGSVIPRPVLEVRVSAGEKPLVLFLCHWKSKIGGAAGTDPLRRSAARVINRRIQELTAERPGIPCIVMGDLNESAAAWYQRGGDLLPALLPDDPQAAERAGPAVQALASGVPDFLLVSGQKPPAARFFPKNAAVFYSPWETLPDLGSYYYKNAWEAIDHFLLSAGLFDQRDWEYQGWEVLARQPFINAAGRPNAYNPRTGNGLSDHLPLALTLIRPPKE
jgi:endonuclease/exonuclease/phosphatase family metal-dependent hydrolase